MSFRSLVLQRCIQNAWELGRRALSRPLNILFWPPQITKTEAGRFETVETASALRPQMQILKVVTHVRKLAGPFSVR